MSNVRDLNKKVGEMEYDGLITDLNPPVQVRGGVLSKLSAEAPYKRGTILARNSADNKLYILGTTGDTLTPHSILCDDCTVGTSADLNQPVYTAGCFHPDKVTVADGYTLTPADEDALRMRNIVFRLPSEEA